MIVKAVELLASSSFPPTVILLAVPVSSSAREGSAGDVLPLGWIPPLVLVGDGEDTVGEGAGEGGDGDGEGGSGVGDGGGGGGAGEAEGEGDGDGGGGERTGGGGLGCASAGGAEGGNGHCGIWQYSKRLEPVSG